MPESAMCHSKILFACEPETAKEFVCELTAGHPGPHMHRGEDAGWSESIEDSEEWPKPIKEVTCRYKLVWEDSKEEIIRSQKLQESSHVDRAGGAKESPPVAGWPVAEGLVITEGPGLSMLQSWMRGSTA